MKKIAFSVLVVLFAISLLVGCKKTGTGAGKKIDYNKKSNKLNVAASDKAESDKSSDDKTDDNKHSGYQINNNGSSNENADGEIKNHTEEDNKILDQVTENGEGQGTGSENIVSATSERDDGN